MVGTQEDLKVAQQALYWQRREFQRLAGSLRARSADIDEVRWMIGELTSLPGSGDSGTPESIVARVWGALNEANNRATAWEREAKGR